MKISFQDKHIIVTGGASGIGLAITQKFLQAGANVHIFDINALAFEELQVELGAQADACYFYKVDITQTDQISAAIESIKQKTTRIDVLVNNAGGAFVKGADNFVETTDEILFSKTVDVNLNGTYNCCRAVLPIMKAQKAGVITQVSSVNALQAFGHPAYSAAKAGLLSLSRSIAVEYGKAGIRSNVVIPGTVKTENWAKRVEKNPQVFEQLKQFYPLNDVAYPDDIAHAVLFLSSSFARFITGAELVVDGGLTTGSQMLMKQVTS